MGKQKVSERGGRVATSLYDSFHGVGAGSKACRWRTALESFMRFRGVGCDSNSPVLDPAVMAEAGVGEFDEKWGSGQSACESHRKSFTSLAAD